jgi:hypothetical protein
MKPKIFVGSSSEGKDIVEALRRDLVSQNCAEVYPWYQSGFTPMNSTLDNIIGFASEYDFGIFVFSPDDLSEIRGREVWTARDNVIFELGLFTSGLGKERNFFLIPADKPGFHLPSDLLGITALTYEKSPEDGYSVQKACQEIAGRISEVETRSKEKGTYVHIVNRMNGHSMDVKDWNMRSGAVVQQWPCHGCDNQIWILQRKGNRHYRIKSLFSGKYLEIPAKYKEEDGAVVQQADATGEDVQQWMLVKLNDGTYQIINKASGKCLTAPSASAEDPGLKGDPHAIVQQTWHGGDNQRWWLTVRLDW